MVQALGARLLDAEGHDVGPTAAAALGAAARLDLSGLHPGCAGATVVVACDVDNPLTGPTGAAAVYGPQKGADPEQVAVARRGADAVGGRGRRCGRCRSPRAYPAPAPLVVSGFAAMAVLGARLRPGVELVLELIGLRRRTWTESTWWSPGRDRWTSRPCTARHRPGWPRRPRAAGVPVVAVAGRCLLDAEALHGAGFDAVHALLDEARRPDEAFRRSRAAAGTAGSAIAHRRRGGPAPDR